MPCSSDQGTRCPELHGKLSKADRTFLNEVNTFLEANWRPSAPAAGRRQADAARTAFLTALAARGWSVPHWPAGVGGTAWTRRECYLFWRALALVGAPVPDPFGVGVIGPLLLEVGTSDQCRRHLKAIRGAQIRWCAHGSLRGAEMPVIARTDTGSTGIASGPRAPPRQPGCSYSESLRKRLFWLPFGWPITPLQPDCRWTRTGSICRVACWLARRRSVVQDRDRYCLNAACNQREVSPEHPPRG